MQKLNYEQKKPRAFAQFLQVRRKKPTLQKIRTTLDKKAVRVRTNSIFLTLHGGFKAVNLKLSDK
jgi:hypothetical protein